MKTDNKLIAEFMAGRPVETHHNQYHTSWNELMPADVVKPKGTFYCVEKEVNADECETQCSDCERWTK
jgi:hypothetical protein